jgi:hydrogenase maturation protease
MSGVVVLGVGNLIMGDEGVGVRCVEWLEGRLPAGVVAIDGGTSTHELLGELENLELLVIVDAVVADGPPGTVIRLEGDHIPSAFSNKLSPHQHGLNDLLANLRFLGRSPRRLVLYGVTPRRIALGMELSAEVAAVVPDVGARVIAELAA